MPEQEHESTLTVLLALGANLGIAIAKIVAAVVTGSASMAAEAGHSVADTFNEVLLIAGLRRSARPADWRTRRRSPACCWPSPASASTS